MIIPVRVLLSIIICFFASLSARFDTLEHLEKYAATLPENVASDATSREYPTFATAYKTRHPGFFKELLYTLRSFSGITTQELWNINDFKNLLEQNLTIRASLSSLKNGEQTIQLPPQGSCVMWGDLHGAFHSLVRTLIQCKKLGFINSNLEIIKDHSYFVFLGNAISHSAYSLETLSVILTLMKKNPDKVIYLQGEQETNGYWENFTMRTQLQEFAKNLETPEDFSIPLSTPLNEFFATLPKILIIHRDPIEKDQAIYVTHRKINAAALHRYETEVLIFGSEKFETQRLSGLEFDGYSSGSALWSLISCPTPFYKSIFQFYYDCFAVVTIGDIILRSSITAYNQHSEKQKGFISTTYDVLYGIPVNNTTDIKKIHKERPYEIGSTGPLTGGSQSLGTSVARGIDAAIYNFNVNGGFSNTYVRNSVFDDELIPRFAEKNIDTLQSYGQGEGATGGQIVIAPIGSETLSAYFDKVKNNIITILFPYVGDKKFRDPSLKNIIHFIPSQADEVKALIDHMINEYNAYNFAFFYQNDAYGTDALEAAHTELKKRGITTWTDIPYSQEQTDFSTQVTALKKANPDTIGFFSISAPTQEFINQTGAHFFIGRHLFGISFVESTDIKIFLKKLGIPITFSYVVPNPDATNLPILQEYHAAMDLFKSPYNSNSLLGFIAGELFIDALKHTKKPISKEAIMQYFETLKNYNFKGLNLTFNPQTRSLSQPVWINTENNTWVSYDT